MLYRILDILKDILYWLFDIFRDIGACFTRNIGITELLNIYWFMFLIEMPRYYLFDGIIILYHKLTFKITTREKEILFMAVVPKAIAKTENSRFEQLINRLFDEFSVRETGFTVELLKTYTFDNEEDKPDDLIKQLEERVEAEPEVTEPLTQHVVQDTGHTQGYTLLAI